MKNFGKLKNVFNNVLVESISAKDLEKKNIFKAYVNTLKKDDVLKTQFNVFNAIENMIEENEFKASEKVKAIVEGIKKYSEKQIVEANQSLVKIIDKYGLSVEDEYEKNTLHENITNLIFKGDVDKYVDSLHETVNYVKSNIIKENKNDEFLPNSMLTSIMVDKFNDAYSTIDESTKKAIKVLLESTEEQKVELFNETVKEVITLINDKLKDAEVTLKESLLAAKENLLGREYNKESFVKDISKILTLKTDLTNE